MAQYQKPFYKSFAFTYRQDLSFILLERTENFAVVMLQLAIIS
jgi:hypothetical protein